MELKFSRIFCLSLLLVSGYFAADTSVMEGDINVKGNDDATIEIWRGETDTVDANQVTISLKCLKETTAAGTDITTAEHAFTDFSSTDFAVSEVMDETTGVAAHKITISKSLVTDARMVTMTVYVYKADGSVTLDGSISTAVKRGYVRVMMKVENWAFCGDADMTCQDNGNDVTADFLDVCLMVTSATDPAKEGDTDVYDLGGGIKLMVPTAYTKDDADATMPNTYPMLSGKDFTLRFEKFTTSVMYDVVVMSEASTETDISVGGFYTRAVGKSGKIRCGNSEEAVKSAANSTVIEVGSIIELKSDGSQITGNGHKILTLANLDFTISDVTSGTFQSIAVKTMNINASLSSGANLKVTLYMFQASGNITQDGETAPVQTGNTKFTVEITDWDFCTASSCKTTNVGEFLEVSLIIKGSGTATKDDSVGDNMGDKYMLGGSSLLMSRKAKIDGGFTDVTPTLDVTGGKQTFKIRFPKFNSEMYYDPTVAVDPADSTVTTSTTTEAPAQSKEISASDVKVNVLGQSGKITIMSAASEASDSNKNKITIQITNLSELKADGGAVKDNGRRFNTFANQDFVFTDLGNGKVMNINARTIKFAADLSNNANLDVTLSIFTADGTITQGTEETEVKRGNVKFSVVLRDWSFCDGSGPCAGDTGEFIELFIEIKGSLDKPTVQNIGANKGKKYNLGGGTVVLSEMIKIDDGEFTAMPDTFPALETQGSKTYFKLRFPKFTNKVFYDPTLSVDPSSGSPRVQASILTLLCFIIGLLLQK